MANFFDPTVDGEGVGGSVDASKPKIQQAWNAWTSKPENNAALLQFGLAMLQPRAPGQSAIGQAANAVAEGGGAAGRVIAQDKVDENTEAERADKLAGIEAKKVAGQAALMNAGAYSRSVDSAARLGELDKTSLDRSRSAASDSARVTADAYSRSVDATAGNAGGKGGTSAALRLQQDFRKWLAKPEDTSGLSTDPVVGAISKTFPTVKSKADLLSDPAARAAAFRLFSQQVTTEAPEESDPATPSPIVTPAPTPGARTVYKNGRPYTWDGIPGHAPVPQ